MRVAVFSTKPYDRQFLDQANAAAGDVHELGYFESRLSAESVTLVTGIPAVSLFVNDIADAPVVQMLQACGVKLIALRSAGFNNVDVRLAAKLGMKVARVPAYSPYAVAEHTIGLILTLNRKLHRAHSRVRENNFALDGLLGFDLYGKTVGVVGTGKIGAIAARILAKGFACRVLAYDPYPNQELAAEGVVTYMALLDVLPQSDIVTLHCPLTPDTHHLIDAEAMAAMKPGVMLVNTSRGALVDTRAAIDALKSGHLGYLGIDVYEEEADLFFSDLSNQVVRDDVFSRLLTFPNVVVTGHQAFFTREAMTNIAETTIGNITAFERGEPLANEVTPDMVKD